MSTTTVDDLLALDITTRLGPVCPKCAKMKFSDGRSCCAAGGAWFKECGDIGDPNFEHTWSDGVLACYESPIEMSRVNVMSYEDNSGQNTHANQRQIADPAFRTGTMDLKCFAVFIGVTLTILQVH